MKKTTFKNFPINSIIDTEKISIEKKSVAKQKVTPFFKILLLGIALFFVGTVCALGQENLPTNSIGITFSASGSSGGWSWTLHNTNSGLNDAAFSSNAQKITIFTSGADRLMFNVSSFTTGNSGFSNSGDFLRVFQSVDGTNWGAEIYSIAYNVITTGNKFVDLDPNKQYTKIERISGGTSNAGKGRFELSDIYLLGNDKCANAANLPCGTSNLAGTTIGASAKASPPTNATSSNGVWYKFTGNGQNTTISSTASGWDHEMTILTASGSCSGWSTVATTDAAYSGGTETYTFNAVNGTVYYVWIAYFTTGSISGNFTISRTCPSPSITTSVSSLTAFSACANTASSQQSFTVSGSNLTANLVVTPPTGFEISSTSGSGFGTSAINLAPSSGSVASTTIYVRMASQASSPSNGNIACSSTGATVRNVAVSGSIVNTAATATTGISSSVTTTSATLAGSFVANCQTITAYGIEYSTTNNFANGTGTQVSSSNQSSGSFTSSVSGLSPNTT